MDSYTGAFGRMRDPVCGALLNEETAAATDLVGASTRAFCSQRCRVRFRTERVRPKAPGGWRSSLPEPAANDEAPGGE